MPRPLLEEKEVIERIRRKLLTRFDNDKLLDQLTPGEALLALAILHATDVISDDLQDIPVAINDLELNPD